MWVDFAFSKPFPPLSIAYTLTAHLPFTHAYGEIPFDSRLVLRSKKFVVASTIFYRRPQTGRGTSRMCGGTVMRIVIAGLAMVTIFALALDNTYAGRKDGMPVSTLADRSFKSGQTFRDCDGCPEMVVIPSGSFTIGS